MWICCTSIERKIRFAALEVVVNLVHGGFAFFLVLLGGYELWIIFDGPQPNFFEELLKANLTVSTLLRQTMPLSHWLPSEAWNQHAGGILEVVGLGVQNDCCSNPKEDSRCRAQHRNHL